MSPTKAFPLISILLFYVLWTGESHPITDKRSAPAHFVFVHGYGDGAWRWYKIKALMEASGYNVTCLDLRGSGIDLTASNKVHTFDEYNEPLVNFMANLNDDQKVILVGHSAGGLSLADVSHKFSKKIKVAVYIAATMLEHGFMTKQDKLDGEPDFARCVDTKSCDRNSKEETGCQFSFISSQEERALSSLLRREVSPKVFDSAKFEGEEGGEVKRVYIKTLCDRVLRPEQQTTMIKRWPPAEVIELQADHGVIASDPFLIFGLLMKIATSVDSNDQIKYI